MAITIKEQSKEATKVYVETKMVEQKEEFTIALLDRQIAQCEAQIANTTARKEALEAKKIAALAVKESVEVT